jgi:tRNA-specific 2-thiouridylase
VGATIEQLEGGGLCARLDEPAYGVAPGQAVVFYEDDVVVGAGLVSSPRD